MNLICNIYTQNIPICMDNYAHIPPNEVESKLNEIQCMWSWHVVSAQQKLAVTVGDISSAGCSSLPAPCSNPCLLFAVVFRVRRG